MNNQRKKCEAQAHRACWTTKGLRRFQKEGNSLLICEYHSKWHFENGFVVVDEEKSYTVDGRIFVKLSEFDYPRRKQFISNLFVEELDEINFPTIFIKQKLVR